MKKTQKIVESFFNHRKRKLNEENIEKEITEEHRIVIQNYIESYINYSKPPEHIYDFLNINTGKLSINRYGELVFVFDNSIINRGHESLGIFESFINRANLDGNIVIDKENEVSVINLNISYDLLSGGSNGMKISIKTEDAGRTWKIN